MQEGQDDGPSPSVWGKISPSGASMIMRKARERRAGTTVSKKTLSKTLAHKIPLLKPAYVQAHLKCANDHLEDPEEE